MIRLAGFLLITLLTIYFWAPDLIRDWKQKSVEFINPAVKEKRLLGDLNYQMEELGDLLNNGALSDKERVKKMNSIIQDSQDKISEVGQINEKGDVTATLNNLLQKVLPKSENKLSPQPTWLPAGTECKTK